ncbi:MAG: hypothetical protein JJ902_05495 [Roseibium sp.]|nr:hypothetical protein [Roseibium sp.]
MVGFRTLSTANGKPAGSGSAGLSEAEVAALLDNRLAYEHVKTIDITENVAAVSITDCFPDLTAQYYVEAVFGHQTVTSTYPNLRAMVDGADVTATSSHYFASFVEHTTTNTGTVTNSTFWGLTTQGASYSPVWIRLHILDVNVEQAFGSGVNKCVPIFAETRRFENSASYGVSFSNLSLAGNVVAGNALTGLTFSWNSGNIGLAHMPTNLKPQISVYKKPARTANV